MTSDPSKGCEGLWRGRSQLGGLPSPGVPRGASRQGNVGWGCPRSNL